jgi:hypothetical protein
MWHSPKQELIRPPTFLALSPRADSVTDDGSIRHDSHKQSALRTAFCRQKFLAKTSKKEDKQNALNPLEVRRPPSNHRFSSSTVRSNFSPASVGSNWITAIF